MTQDVVRFVKMRPGESSFLTAYQQIKDYSVQLMELRENARLKNKVNSSLRWSQGLCKGGCRAGLRHTPHIGEAPKLFRLDRYRRSTSSGISAVINT